MRDDWESEQKQIKEGKMPMDEGNQRRGKGISKMSKQGEDSRVDVKWDIRG